MAAALRFGLDRLLAEPALRRPLAGRRVALLAHPASVTRELTHSLDALAALPDLTLSAAFGPQHGLRGDKQDNMVESPDYVDPLLGIPVAVLLPLRAFFFGRRWLWLTLAAAGCAVALPRLSAWFGAWFAQPSASAQSDTATVLWTAALAAPLLALLRRLPPCRGFEDAT